MDVLNIFLILNLIVLTALTFTFILLLIVCYKGGIKK